MANEIKYLHDDAANGLQYCGYTDWRLPNVKELTGIIDSSQTPFGLDSAVWGTTPSPYTYWTSTTRPGFTTRVKRVEFSNDGTQSYSPNQTGPYFVRPVRGGRLNANW